jgi:hypothetical protein
MNAWRIFIIHRNDGNWRISEVEQLAIVLLASGLFTSDLIMMEEQNTLHLFTFQ